MRRTTVQVGAVPLCLERRSQRTSALAPSQAFVRPALRPLKRHAEPVRAIRQRQCSVEAAGELGNALDQTMQVVGYKRSARPDGQDLNQSIDEVG